MARQSITRSDQHCISQCIFKHWSEHSDTDPDQRAEKYKACLSDCRICE